MGTHPIFESDFDCLTEVDLKWLIPFVLKRSFESEINASSDINMIALTEWTSHGESQRVSIPESDDDSRDKPSCHPSGTVQRLLIVTDVRARKTSSDSLLTTYPSSKF